MGFPVGYVKQLQSQSYPTITLSGVTSAASIGAANTGVTDQSQYSYVVSITKTIGKQNLKAGYVYRTFNYYLAPETAGNGSFTFNGEYTSATGKSVTNGPQAIADLLLGLPSAASVQINPANLNDNLQYQALFAQDDVRVTNKLTANVGLRYEYELGQRESANQYDVGFDPNVAYQFPTANGVVAAKGGIVFASQNGAPSHSEDLSHTKFSPRFGLNYEAAAWYGHSRRLRPVLRANRVVDNSNHRLLSGHQLCADLRNIARSSCGGSKRLALQSIQCFAASAQWQNEWSTDRLRRRAHGS